MSTAFIVEVEEIAAGLAVREPGGYRFYATDRAFSRLEGQIFANPKAAERAAVHFAAGHRRFSPARHIEPAA